jgi:hypothetical protein
MLILAAFATIALLVAGLFAVTRGDTFTFATVLTVLALAMYAVVPPLLALLNHVQHAIDAALPIALR